jgi:hypothetical protein
MEAEGSLPQSHVSATCPNRVPDQSSPCPPIAFPEDQSYYYLPIYAWVFQVVSSPQVSPPKPCIRLSPIRAICPAHLILLDLIARTIMFEEYRSLSLSLCSFLYSPVTSSLLGPNILLSTLFSNTFSLRSSLNVSDQVSHPYKRMGKIKILYTLIFKFMDSKLKDRYLLIKN